MYCKGPGTMDSLNIVLLVRNYMMTVKKCVQGDAESLDTFLKVMRDLRRYIDVNDRNIYVLVEPVVSHRMKDLFTRHPQHLQLISGFNMFLQQGFEIPLPLQEKNQPEVYFPDWYRYDEGIKFVNKVIALSASDTSLHKELMELITSFRPENAGAVVDLNRKVVVLLAQRDDLLEGFTQCSSPCLPENGTSLVLPSNLTTIDKWSLCL
uniref:Uncharacterized protein n=1 Tax=Physcomitrium patens TaxID=3218 RepID=A0A2K1KLY6_PHYPA|nr:hypothetical protein PHYPA_005679 [Physcomitrium patens]